MHHGPTQNDHVVGTRLLAGGLAGKAAKGLTIAAQCAAEHRGVHVPGF